MQRGAIAYAYVRMRACKSRLLTRADALPLFAASDGRVMERVVATLGLEDPFQRVLQVYARAIHDDSHGAPLFRALRQRHEIEDVKLRWRKAVKRGASVSELAESFARTPYAGIAATVARAHGNDIAAAELAFDRWVSQRLAEEARALPRREALARQLVGLVVRERDAEIVRRGSKWYGLTSVSGPAEDVMSIRRERLRLCRRAFIGDPFRLAPPLAVILMAEEEARAVRALVERCGDETLDPPLLRALAGSQLGA